MGSPGKEPMHHKLAAQASALSRQIYASLPWGYRVAGLLLRLANSAQEAFGRYAYSIFIRDGVTDMPDINGEPASSLREKMRGRSGPNYLPKGYGRKFAEKVWAVALSKLRSPEAVEEAVSRVTLAMASGKMQIDEGAPLAKAEALVLTSVLNAGRDALRMKRRVDRRMDDLGGPDDEGVEVEISDPKSFSKLDDVLGPSDLKRLLDEVKVKVNPRAAEWIEAQLEGMAKKDLAEKWEVNPSAVVNFENRYLDKIKLIVHHYLEA